MATKAFLGIGTQFLSDMRQRRKITAITAADPGVVTIVGTAFTDGDIIIVHNVKGMTELNGNVYKVAGTSGQTFELTTIDDVDVDTSGFTAYASGGFVELFQEAASSPDFVKFGEINDLQPPSPTAETVDVTHMGSEGGYREFITGLLDGGEVTFMMNMNFDDYQLIKAHFELKSLRKYKIILSDSTTSPTYFIFTALVTGIPPQIPTADKVTVDVTMKVSGKTDFDNV
jgi:predicted secreted protein